MSNDMRQPVVNIVGERVALGPLVREHIPLFTRWRNDFAVARTFGGTPRAHTIDAVTARYDAGNGNDYEFIIYERATWRPVGRTYLFDVDWRGRTAAFGIIIGEADCRGKGYGTETARLMLDYAFTALGLNSVSLHVYEYNTPARKAYARAGFVESGRMRQARWYAGRFWDVILMDCLASEFESPVLHKIFAPDIERP